MEERAADTRDRCEHEGKRSRSRPRRQARVLPVAEIGAQKSAVAAPTLSIDNLVAADVVRRIVENVDVLVYDLQDIGGDTALETCLAEAREAGFVGMEKGPHGDGAKLVDELMSHMTERRFVYAHHWEQGDMLVWDNRCLVHAATWYERSMSTDWRSFSTWYSITVRKGTSTARR